MVSFSKFSQFFFWFLGPSTSKPLHIDVVEEETVENGTPVMCTSCVNYKENAEKAFAAAYAMAKNAIRNEDTATELAELNDLLDQRQSHLLEQRKKLTEAEKRETELRTQVEEANDRADSYKHQAELAREESKNSKVSFCLSI